MVRDESTNIRKNLPLWTYSNVPFFDAYVIAVDSRTEDDTIEAIGEVTKGTPTHVFEYDFKGFGQGRTEVFKEAWRVFSNITHVMVADPDWKPNMDLINKSDLISPSSSFEFLIWDRSGITTRHCNWLMRHQEGLYFDYYVHEFLRFEGGGPYVEDTKVLGWEVSEVEGDQSWHQTVGHGDKSGASRSYKRIQFDVSLLEMEQKDDKYKDSQHTLYYLGAAHCAMVEGSEDYKVPFLNEEEELTDLQRTHANNCVTYLERRFRLHENAQERELTWSSLRWLAYCYFYILQEYDKAELWYKKCVEFDVERVDCLVELSKLYSWSGRHVEAYDTALKAATIEFPDRGFSNNFYIYDCVVPLQVSRAAINYIIGENQYRVETYALGHHMGTVAGMGCMENNIPLEGKGVLDGLGNAYDGVFHSTKVPGEPEPKTTFRCMKQDNSIESEAIRKTNGKHYFCDNDNVDEGSEKETRTYAEVDGNGNMGEHNVSAPSVCPKTPSEKYPSIKPFEEDGISTPGHFYDYAHNAPRFSSAPANSEHTSLFIATKSNVQDVLKSAKEFKALNYRKHSTVYVGLAGTIDSDVWNTFLVELAAINSCPPASSIQGVLLGPDYDIRSKMKNNPLDYIDVGAGILSTQDVKDVPKLMEEVKGSLKIGGIAGFLVHEISESSLEKIRKLQKTTQNLPISPSTAVELSNYIALEAFGYSSKSLASQIYSISRSFTLEDVTDILSKAGLQLLSPTREYNHLSFFASTTSNAPPLPLHKLSESTKLLPRSPQALEKLHRAILRHKQDNPTLTTTSFAFPGKIPYTITLTPLTPYMISSALNAETIMDAYKTALDSVNRQAVYLKSDAPLTFQEFLAEVKILLDQLSEHHLLTTAA